MSEPVRKPTPAELERARAILSEALGHPAKVGEIIDAIVILILNRDKL
jgi:hypothetical protein